MELLDFSVDVDGRRLVGQIEIGGVVTGNGAPNVTIFDAQGEIVFRGVTYRTPVQLQIADNFEATPGEGQVDAISIGFQIDGVVSLLGQVSTSDTGLLGSTPTSVSLNDFEGDGTVGVFDEETATNTTTSFLSFSIDMDRADPVVIVPTDGDDLFEGTPEADVFDGGGGADTLFGFGGRDTLEGGAGADEIDGGAGADRLFGGGGRDILRGEGAGDDLFGGGGRDQLFGGRGRDELFGNGGRDMLFGENGRDMLFGGGGRDALTGDGGRDALLGGGGRDTLDGGRGRDTLEGGGARDVLEGGAGRDLLTGGAGADTFVFSAGDGVDTITDFALGQDVIDLQSLEIGFGDLTIETEGGDAVVTASGVTIILNGVDGAELREGDFLF